MEYEIEVKFQDEIIKGILIKEDDSYLTIKLSSGYNANLKKSQIEIISKNKIEKKDSKKVEKKSKTNSINLPKITILHTGGTIASKVDYKTGAVSSKFTPDELLALYPELSGVAQIDAVMIGNLFSEDMRFSHYNLMLEGIKNAIENGSRGVIISHGTDTLHYTSCALQYSLENLSIPVILVGAQRSSDRPSSDAYSNLDAAVDFILDNDKNSKKFLRVGVCMHKSIDDNHFLIFDSINLKKMHSSRRDAFKQINYLPFAQVDDDGNVEILREELLSLEVKEKVSFTKYDIDLKIGFFKAHPNLNSEEIFMLSFYDAIIIEGTGLGHLAVNGDDNILENLKNLCEKTKVIMGVQTVYGETNMNIYSSGIYIKEAGVLGNFMNLTTETLFMRAAYCLSKDKNLFDKLWDENLEGFKIRGIDIKDE